MSPEQPLDRILADYDASAALDMASTIPASWYTDPRIAALEQQAVFAATWQVVGRADQLAGTGCFVTATVAGEPIVVVRGQDGLLRAFYNVCRHHAAAVATEPQGCIPSLRCPYHGWTYALDGALKGITDFEGVREFERAENGLVPLAVAEWEGFVFVHLDPRPELLADHLGGMAARIAPLALGQLRFVERRSYIVNCNWKVYVDNYLDGGYHVPHMHKSLSSVLDYGQYKIENGERFCLQSSPTAESGGDAATAAVREGHAYYFWLYPNFMINWYEGVMDTNLVLPLDQDRCLVHFDFFFRDSGDAAREYQQQSMTVSDRVQAEDIAICESVQRGLASRAYKAGRLSVKREAGEHLFHRLLAEDLRRGYKRDRLSEKSVPRTMRV